MVYKFFSCHFKIVIKSLVGGWFALALACGTSEERKLLVLDKPTVFFRALKNLFRHVSGLPLRKLPRVLPLHAHCQSQHVVYFILPACRASHIITPVIVENAWFSLDATSEITCCWLKSTTKVTSMLQVWKTRRLEALWQPCDKPWSKCRQLALFKIWCK